MGEVPGLLEDLQPAARDRVVGAVGVSDGDQGVQGPPDDQRGSSLGQVEQVVRTHSLPAGPDHGAQGVDEGRARWAVGKRRVPAGRLSDGWPHPQRQPTEDPGHGDSGIAHVGMGDHRQDQLGSRERRGPQGDAHLAAEPPAGHEHGAFAVVVVLVGELHGDAAAQRVTDHGGAVVAEQLQQIAKPTRQRAQRVVRLGLVGVPVTEEVGSDHMCMLGQCRHHRNPRGAAARDPMNQHDNGKARIPRHAVGDPVPVQLDLLASDG